MTDLPTLPPPTSLKRIASLDFLQPRFRAKVYELLRRLNAQGHDAIAWETYRTRARVKLLSDRGTGAKPLADGSIPIGCHEMGLAVDIVSKSKRWTPAPAFWTALGREAKALGLTWGGAWKRVDKPHVQAIAVKEQAAYRWRLKARGYSRVEWEPPSA